MTSYKFKDILPVFRKNFVEDFDCKDVETTLRCTLQKREVDIILKSDHKEQPYVLFMILNDQAEETVKKFVNDLKARGQELNYDFLMNAIKEECCHPSLSTETYIKECDSLYSNNQMFAKYNVPRIEPYLRLTKALLELRPSKNVLVDGVLGAGKQWLVLDVCSSYDVQRKMDFKIIWLNLKHSHTMESDLEMLQSLLHQIDCHWSNNNCDHSRATGLSIKQRIESTKYQLRRMLKSKAYENCLLVLLNVQNLNTWKVFNLGCKILLTTRNKCISSYLSSATTAHVPLEDALTPSEVETLFLKYLNCSSQELASARDIKTTNPRKLSIIAECIRDDLANFDNFRDVNRVKLTTVINQSLSVLELRYRKMYEKLFIFPESAHIPTRLLPLLWSLSTNNSTYEEPMVIVNKLHKHSLIEKQPHSKPPTITVPSIYLELNLRLDNEAALHKKIVDSYNIFKIFEENNDLMLPNLDSYFYAHIGHHLMAIDYSESVTLLRVIFLDFRFLEQKIRHDTTPWNATGSILNTLHQLKLYKERIIDNDPAYDRLLNSLLDFLPKIEENLIRSTLTCLLRVALMAEEGAIYDEARRQIQRFPDYVWFTEHGRFHQQRQIINIGKDQVKHAVYLDNDFCLMALNNNQMLLIGVSFEAETTYVLSDKKDPSEISKMCVFNHQNHVLTLHVNGTLKLWCLWPESETENNARRRQSDNSILYGQHAYSQLPKQSRNRNYKQLVNGVVKRSLASNADRNICTFYLEEETGIGHTSIQLHVAFNNGDICICDWDASDEEFKSLHTPPLKTEQLKIRCLVKVLKRFYVLCTANCNLTLWDLRNSSREQIDMRGYSPNINDSPIKIDAYTEEDGISGTVLLLIFKHSVWRCRFDKDTISIVYAELLKLPEIGFITCGKRSSDGQYLILGTSEGLIVYDLKISDALLRCNVSENISCLDIYELSDPVYKYIILCGAVDKHILHIHTLRVDGDQGLRWLHNVDDDDELKEFSTGSGVCLRSLVDMNCERTLLFAVDSKERIHQIQPAAHGKNASIASRSTISTTHAAYNSRITAICAYNNNQIFVAYANGFIIDICHDVELAQEHISEPIDFLKQISSEILVASAWRCQKTVIFKLTSAQSSMVSSLIQWPLHLEFDTMHSQLFDEHYLLLFSEQGVCHINLLKPIELFSEETEDQLVGFGLKNRLLFLALKDNSIKIFNMDNNGTRLNYQKRCFQKIRPQSAQITYMTVANNASMFALGFQNGNVELFTYDKDSGIQLIYSITEGHKQHISQLRFSPCNSVLISCAEQLCFWSLSYMRNNQFRPESSSRVSRRHKSYFNNRIDAVDASPFGSAMDSEESLACCISASRNNAQAAAQAEITLWRDKRGSAIMPELLACIKFVGNGARKFFADSEFAQFFVIDDEGVYYHLQIIQSNPSLPISTLRSSLDYDSVKLIHSMTDASLTSPDEEEGVDVVGIAEVQASLESQRIGHLDS